MDPEKFKQKKKRVAGTTDVNVVKTIYIDSKYKIRPLKDRRATDSAWVRVAELISSGPDDPLFIFRWDEKAEALDVDIKNINNSAEKYFRKQTGGYRGHHTTQVKGKLFKVDIEIPQRKIFEGEIDVGLLLELRIEDSLKLTEDNIKVVHKKVLIKEQSQGTDIVSTESK